MKIVSGEYPPNIDKIRAVLDVSRKGIFYCYGDTIYNPDGFTIPWHIVAHEEVHQKQQGDDVEGWWGKYLSDVEFRLSQEVEAYQAEYKSYKDKIKMKSARRKFLDLKAEQLSSEIYGNILTYQEARNTIKQ